MKNAMLFFVALMFSVGANAATLDLSTLVSAGGASQSVDLTSNDVVLAGGTITSTSQSWLSLFSLTTDADTAVDIEWSFNPVSNLTAATLVFFDLGNAALNQMFDITGDFSFSAVLMASSSYVIGIIDASSKVLLYDVSVTSVSAVPLPAALWLLMPALLGFVGFRHRNASIQKLS